jgi:hypothetical protein
MTRALKKIICATVLLTTTLVFEVNYAFTEIVIGNGKLYNCIDQQIVALRNNQVVSLNIAVRRFNAIISRANIILATSAQGSSKYKQALRNRRAAARGRSDAKNCLQGELVSVVGSWNLITENGSTPAELGYTSLTIDFTINSFESIFTGTTLTCDWTGTYTNPDQGNILTIRTRTGEGGTICEDAIGQSRNAQFELSSDGNTLTLDYRPSGTLQVFERVS